MSHEIIKSHDRLLNRSTLALGVFLTAAMFETTATLHDRRKRIGEPNVISKFNASAEKSTIYIPGFHANGQVIGEIFEPVIMPESNFHSVVWDTSGFHPGVAKDKLVEARRKDGGLPLYVHASSMGMHPFADWMRDPAFRDEMGEVAVVCGDSNFYDKSDIALGTRAAMLSTRFLPPTFTPGKLFETAMGIDDTDISVHDPDIRDGQIADWRESSAKGPYGAARHQVAYIQTKRGRQRFDEAFKDVGSFRYVSARYDDVADPYASFAKYHDDLGDVAAHYIDTDRPRTSHAMGPGFRRSIASLLYYSDERLDSVPNLIRLTPRPIRVEEEYVFADEYQLTSVA